MFHIFLAAMALTASEGCPKTAPGQPPPISADPDWRVLPDSNDIFWAYPPKAYAEKLEGRAVIECAVTIQGTAESCKTLEETPPGYGFGEAAISVTPKMLFRPKVECGVVVPGQVRIPLVFKFPEVDPNLSAAPLDRDDKKLMTAVRLVRAMAYTENFKSWVEDSAWSLIEEESKGRPVSAEERGAITDAARQVWLESKDKFANALARSLATNLTESELAEAVTFFEGPVGAKMVKLNDKIGGDMHDVYESIEPNLILEFHQHYCEKLPAMCTPPDAS